MSYIQELMPEVKKIEKELNAGFYRTPKQRELCRLWLVHHMTANDLTISELRDLVWEDSDWVFSQIFD